MSIYPTIMGEHQIICHYGPLLSINTINGDHKTRPITQLASKFVNVEIFTAFSPMFWVYRVIHTHKSNAAS